MQKIINNSMVMTVALTLFIGSVRAQSDALPNSAIGICNGDSIQLVPTEGISFQWVANPWMTASQLESENPVVTPLESTTFEVEITLENNQTEINWFEINVEETPNFTLQPSQESGCTPMPISFSAEGIDNTYIYSWELEGGVFEYLAPSFIHTYTTPGEYIPSLTVESPIGCIYHEELNSSILIEEHPQATFAVNRDLLTTLNGTLQCEDPTVGAATYLWTTSTGHVSDELNPSFFFEAEQAFEIEVCLQVGTPLGCSQTTCKTIDYKPNLLLHMPEVFTPNNDGLNDTFGPVMTGVNNNGFHFIIWNRWGAVVFETNDPNEPWNSLVMNSGKICQDGRYHWQMTALPSALGEKQVMAGSIFLIR